MENQTMTIAIGSDHRGFSAKEVIKRALEARGIEVVDVGCGGTESCDYNDFGEMVAAGVETGKYPLGIAICNSGLGMSIATNRYPHVRATLCHDEAMAKMSRQHNNSNLLVLGAILQPESELAGIVDAWLDEKFPEENRQVRRANKLTNAGNRVIEIAHLQDADREIYDVIMGHKEQEEGTVNLIASENLTSRAVREAQGSILKIGRASCRERV